jgi:hypothetical protein
MSRISTHENRLNVSYPLHETFFVAFGALINTLCTQLTTLALLILRFPSGNTIDESMSEKR